MEGVTFDKKKKYLLLLVKVSFTLRVEVRSVDEEISGLRESDRLESSFMIYGDRCIKILNFCRMFLCIGRWSFN